MGDKCGTKCGSSEPNRTEHVNRPVWRSRWRTAVWILSAERDAKLSNSARRIEYTASDEADGVCIGVGVGARDSSWFDDLIVSSVK